MSKINNKGIKTSGAKALENGVHCTSVPLTTRSEKPICPTKLNRSIFATQSDRSILKIQETGLKQKLVNKVKSWSNKDKHSHIDLPSTSHKPDPHVAILTSAIESLALNNTVSEDNIQPEKFKAKDSLESILGAKTEQCSNSNVDSKLAPLNEANVSEILISNPAHNIDSSIKHVPWDPWNRLGRISRKDKRRKEKSPHTSSERSPSFKKEKDHVAGDEPLLNTIESNQTVPRPQESYEYQPYKTHRKSVDFVNEVAVTYFTGDEIISKSMEPLKKELDQQIRNKEMRRGHVPCTLLNKKGVGVDDYMSAWFKK